jgi:hypothetical protein
LTIKLTPNIISSRVSLALLLVLFLFLARQIFSCQRSEPIQPAGGGPPGEILRGRLDARDGG